MLDNYEGVLKKVYLNPYLDNNIEAAHFHIWDEIRKKNMQKQKEGTATLLPIQTNEDIFYAGGSSNFDETTGQYKNEIRFDKGAVPEYISFEQYLYSENHNCRACRRFVREYDRLISESTFVYLFDIRYFIKLLLHEAKCMLDFINKNLGEAYEDESEQQVAQYFYSWTQMVSNYKRRIEEEVTRQVTELPPSEVDYLSKKQAAQFQAFFSIRVAAYTEKVDNTLFSLKKDLIDNCNVLYEKYLEPALLFKTQVAVPLELNLQTSNFFAKAPNLAEEIVTANNSLRGNFGSVLTDLLQRNNQLSVKFDRLLSMISQRRVYINYIDQISSKALNRKKIIIKVNEDHFAQYITNIRNDPDKSKSFKSMHAQLNDLETDDHPQYLLRSSGTIIGDILVGDKVTIDGVDISEHSHNGFDGSKRIKSTDIDYETPRIEFINSGATLGDEENAAIEVTVDSFIPDIIEGGVPVIDTVINISVPDHLVNRYEYEILYVEL